MNLPDLITIFIFLIVPLAIAAIAPYLLSNIVIGRFQPIIILITTILGGIFLSLFIYFGSNFSSIIPRSFLFVLPLVFFVGLSSTYIKNIFVGIQLRPEDILLDLGRIQSKAGLFTGALTFCIFLFNVVLFFTRTVTEFYVLSFAALFGLSSLMSVINSLSKVYLTKQGFTQFIGTIKWEQMQRYIWGGRIENKIRLSFKANGEFSYHVPIEMKNQVEAVFEGRVERLIRDSTIRRRIFQSL